MMINSMSNSNKVTESVFSVQLEWLHLLKHHREIKLASILTGFSFWRTTANEQIDTQVWSGIWSFCELFIGIIAACLPTLASIVSKARWNTVTNSARHLFSYSLPRRSRSTEASTSDVDLSEHPLPEYRTWTNAGYEERSGQSEDAKTHVSSVESDRNGIIIKNEFRQTHEVV